jgi:hypothetical protein
VTGEILSIDVSSELETLCTAQLRGTWQVPAELVRLALRLGCDEVSVCRQRRGFTFSWSGPPLDVDLLADLRTVLDGEAGSDERQRAIAAIENSKMEALLWAAGLRGARIRVVNSDGKCRWKFEHQPRRRPRLLRETYANASETVEVHWGCQGLDRRRALRWLAIATRFVPARVLVNGNPGPRGFAGGLFHVRIEEPVPCTLGLTRSGDDPVLWLLRDGVVSARATVPGFPPFEAAVELGGIVAPGASAADMRRAVTPYLGELVDRAVWMMVEVSGRFPEMTASGRERLCLLLLRAARKGLRTSEIKHLALLRNAADDRRMSVEGIRRLADRTGGLLSAIDRDERLGDGLIDPKSTLLASGEVRDLLTELTGIRFQSPSRRQIGLAGHVVNWTRAITGDLLRRLRGVFAGRDVPADELQPQEVTVLAALRSALSPIEVRYCAGRGAVGETAGGVVVPRSNAAMTAGVDLVAAEPSWLYPFLLALNTGLEPPAELRACWLEVIRSTNAKN